MSDLDTQSQTTDNQVFGFVKYVLSEFLSKITVVTASMSDVSNQIKFLTTMSSQAPTRADLLEKVDKVYNTLSEEITKDLLENLKSQHKDLAAVLDKIFDKIDTYERNHVTLKQIVDKNTATIEDSAKKLEVLSEGFKKSNIVVGLLIKVIAGVIAGIPILWSLFTWVSSMSHHTGP